MKILMHVMTVAITLTAGSACEQRNPEVTRSHTASSAAQNQHAENYESVGADTTPAAIIRRYYSAINSRRYNDAYALWSQSGRASGKSEADFAAGFAETTSVRVTEGDSARVEGAAGSQYATIPVEVDATLRDGKHQHFVGTYTLRRAMVDGATPEQRQWRIYSAKLQ
ncbi:MAG TPA: hypothetical protein VJ840_08445 [Gemmatimonadaceae bacterium]|nr:hypothetical protein [Gemmatimonadaceae bacterium]